MLPFSFLVFACSCSKTEVTPPKGKNLQSSHNTTSKPANEVLLKDGGGTVQTPIIQGIVNNQGNSPVSKTVVRLINLNAPFNVKTDTTNLEGLYSIEAAVSTFRMEFDAPNYALKVVTPVVVRTDTQLDVVLQ